MTSLLTARLALGLLWLLCASTTLGSPASAAPVHSAPVAHSGAQAPVHVSGCNPQQGSTSAPQFGYVPAYVPPGQHAWSDPYGRQYYQSPALTAREVRPTLRIDYVNIAPRTLREVEFGLVAGGSLVAEVRDIGTFSHGAEIKHVFALRPSTFPLGSSATRCVLLRAIYQNGSVWTNPHLPQMGPGLYR